MEGYLDYLKKEYEKTDATWHLKTSGWEELARRIGLLETPKQSFLLRNLAIAFAVFLIFLVGTYKIAQAAIPGDPLYPVKILSEKIIQGTTGSNQIVIDNRADEIVGLSRQKQVKTQELEQVVSEYKQNVEETKKQIQDSGEPNPEFQQKLSHQHSEFDKVVKENPHVEGDIKDAQDSSDHGGD